MNTAYKLGEPITGHIVGRVIRSELEGYSSGDYIYTEEAPFQEYAVVLPGASQLRRIEKNAATWVEYIGVLGMVTRTAWLGFYSLAKAKKIAKQQGLKVIGSAGSDEKVKYLKEELGVDAAFNYKTEDLKDVLKREGPIDIYWDHIGGKTLEAVIDNMNHLGRVIVCGYIDQYNSKDNTEFGVKNLSLVNSRELSITGFFVGSVEKREGDFGFFKEAPKLFLLDILQGKNVGKAVVIVADE
ncbi:hypothetical protein FS837_000254 [Tulasnella sp. UAMH 9824]|nr:hypothetical protein FS837_000254 [Tulasnella sp. UAMH 9824]